MIQVIDYIEKEDVYLCKRIDTGEYFKKPREVITRKTCEICEGRQKVKEHLSDVRRDEGEIAWNGEREKVFRFLDECPTCSLANKKEKAFGGKVIIGGISSCAESFLEDKKQFHSHACKRCGWNELYKGKFVDVDE